MVQLEKVCETSSIDDLSNLSDASQKGSREFEELYRVELRKFFDEKALPPPFSKTRSTCFPLSSLTLSALTN